MKYNSIGEYFYRLSNRCLGFAILPVVLVWAAFLLNQYFFSGLPWLQPGDKILLNAVGVAGIIIILIYCLQAYVIKNKLRKIIGQPSLGLRMKLYISIVLIRFRAFSTMLLLICSGVFLTADLIFLYVLPIPLVSFIVNWPTRWRVSRDLKLKPEENEILKNKTLGV